MLESLNGQEVAGSYLCLLLLDECIYEIKIYLTKKHMMKEMKKVGNHQTEVFPSLCTTPPEKIISITSYLLKLSVVSINYLCPYEISYQTLIYFS